jgi:hypothetical protein
MIDILGYYTRRAHTFRPLRDQELALLLNRRVDIVSLVRTVWEIIVGHVVNFMLLQKFWCDNPWTIWDHFIHPSAMTHGLCTLCPRQNSQSFPLVCFRVSGYTDNKICLWKGLLGLFELSHVTGTNVHQ